ncbi:MAG: PEP-CTERM sorting domain-containing protein [Ideonella sp.]|nr:PEP-CTERM sorting domain-containing protein [Ideonella sp.]
MPLNLRISVGNAGGNAQNTGYSVSPTGVVTFTTPLAGTNAGTANVTFVQQIPEPGALSLAGLALLGLAFAGKKRKATTAA